MLKRSYYSMEANHLKLRRIEGSQGGMPDSLTINEAAKMLPRLSLSLSMSSEARAERTGFIETSLPTLYLL